MSSGYDMLEVGGKAATAAAPNDTCFKKLSMGWRIAIFVIMLVVGFVLCSVGSGFLKKDNLTGFLCCYIIGFVLALFSTLFLKGCKAQLKVMFDKLHIGFTIACLVTFLIVVFVGAFYKSDSCFWVVFPFYLLSFICLILYALSLIPCCAACLKTCLENCMTCCCKK